MTIDEKKRQLAINRLKQADESLDEALFGKGEKFYWCSKELFSDFRAHLGLIKRANYHLWHHQGNDKAERVCFNIKYETRNFYALSFEGLFSIAEVNCKYRASKNTNNANRNLPVSSGNRQSKKSKQS